MYRFLIEMLTQTDYYRSNDSYANLTKLFMPYVNFLILFIELT